MNHKQSLIKSARSPQMRSNQKGITNYLKYPTPLRGQNIFQKDNKSNKGLYYQRLRKQAYPISRKHDQFEQSFQNKRQVRKKKILCNGGYSNRQSQENKSAFNNNSFKRRTQSDIFKASKIKKIQIQKQPGYQYNFENTKKRQKNKKIKSQRQDATPQSSHRYKRKIVQSAKITKKERRNFKPKLQLTQYDKRVLKKFPVSPEKPKKINSYKNARKYSNSQVRILNEYHMPTSKQIKEKQKQRISSLREYYTGYHDNKSNNQGHQNHQQITTQLKKIDQDFKYKTAQETSQTFTPVITPSSNQRKSISGPINKNSQVNKSKQSIAVTESLKEKIIRNINELKQNLQNKFVKMDSNKSKNQTKQKKSSNKRQKNDHKQQIFKYVTNSTIKNKNQFREKINKQKLKGQQAAENLQNKQKYQRKQFIDVNIQKGPQRKLANYTPTMSLYSANKYQLHQLSLTKSLKPRQQPILRNPYISHQLTPQSQYQNQTAYLNSKNPLNHSTILNTYQTKNTQLKYYQNLSTRQASPVRIRKQKMFPEKYKQFVRQINPNAQNKQPFQLYAKTVPLQRSNSLPIQKLSSNTKIKQKNEIKVIAPQSNKNLPSTGNNVKVVSVDLDLTQKLKSTIQETNAIFHRKTYQQNLTDAISSNFSKFDNLVKDIEKDLIQSKLQDNNEKEATVKESKVGIENINKTNDGNKQNKSNQQPQKRKNYQKSFLNPQSTQEKREWSLEIKKMTGKQFMQENYLEKLKQKIEQEAVKETSNNSSGRKLSLRYGEIKKK